MRRRARGPAARAYARAPLPGGRTPWREAAFAVVDLETSGLDPRRDEIIAWAVVPVDGGRIELAAARDGLVRPERPPPAATVRVHGLRAADLAAGAALDEAADALLEALRGRILVAHSAWVERRFLARALRRRGARLRGGIVDTLALGRLHLLDRDGVLPPALPLERLAAELGLPVHRRHSAAGDALTTAQVFLALAARSGRAATVRTLTRAERRLEVARTYDVRAPLTASGRRESNPP
jgi:DNA polymerase III subunit epsilon